MPFIFCIKDNIILDDCGKDDEERIWAILANVGLEEKIKNQPQGVNLQLTRMFDKQGMDFSGGERQKLAIARALAKECDIYIFDEPSSALDPESEDQLYQCIAAIPKGKTVIMISHRLSSIFITSQLFSLAILSISALLCSESFPKK